MKSIKFLKTVAFMAAVLIGQSFTTTNNNNAVSGNCPPAEYAVEDWDLLGVRTVSSTLDRDEIEVTAARGAFKRLKFTVKGSPILLQKMIVHYGNGEVYEHAIRYNIAAGSESREIDLPGNNRIIKKVVFWYEKANWGAAGAPVVSLWGMR
jgi:hypothetical protein